MAQHREETSTPRTGLRTTTRRVLATVIAAGALTAVGQPLVANAANAAEIDHDGVHPQTVQSTTTGTDQHTSVKLLVNSTSTPRAEPAAADADGYVKPADGRITSGFGSRSGQQHEGVDIANRIGAPVHSVTSGEVISAGPAEGFGQWVRVHNHDGATTIYGHVNTVDVHVGQHVTSGQQIATVGDKGETTGPHLHFGVKQGSSATNPVSWLDQRGVRL